MRETSDELRDPPCLGELLLGALQRSPGSTALVDGERTLSYGEVAQRVAATIAVFEQRGLSAGNSLALLAPNCDEAVVAILACYIAGLRLTPLHPLGAIEDHCFIAEDAEVDCLLIDERAYPGRTDAMLEHISLQPVALAIGGDDSQRDVLRQRQGCGTATLCAQSRRDEPLLLMYTGGTTGRPKGIIHSNASLMASITNFWCEGEWPPQPNFLAVTPVSHAAHLMVFLTLLAGGRFVMAGPFTPKGFCDAIEAHRINTSLVVPTMLYGLLDHLDTERADLSGLTNLYYGAAPASPSRLRQALERLGPVLTQFYGQVEAPMSISVLRRHEHLDPDPALLGSCGRPTAQCRVALLDDRGQPVGTQEVGEICIRGPLLMQAYWKRPEQTAEALEHGWLHTGDLARRDERGFLYIVDRKKDMIVSGGFNVFPSEIEDILYEQPEVARCAVIGIPDSRWGEAVCAIVVLRDRGEGDAQSIRQLIRERKGPVYAPKRVEFLTDIPLTALGKPDKKALRQQFWAPAERQV